MRHERGEWRFCIYKTAKRGETKRTYGGAEPGEVSNSCRHRRQVLELVKFTNIPLVELGRGLNPFSLPLTAHTSAAAVQYIPQKSARGKRLLLPKVLLLQLYKLHLFTGFPGAT